MTGLAQRAQLFKAGEAVCHFLTRTDCPPAPARSAEGTQPAGPLPGSPVPTDGQVRSAAVRPSLPLAHSGGLGVLRALPGSDLASALSKGTEDHSSDRRLGTPGLENRRQFGDRPHFPTFPGNDSREHWVPRSQTSHSGEANMCHSKRPLRNPSPPPNWETLVLGE